MKLSRKISDQEGMIVIEATITLTVFLLVVAALIYLINIFTLHNKLQFSLEAAARRVASYSYLYQATSIRKAEQTIYADFDQHAQANVNAANQVYDSVTKTVETVNQVSTTWDNITKVFNGGQNAAGDLMSISSVNDFNSLKSDIDKLSSDYNELTASAQQLGNDVKGTYTSWKASAAQLKDRFTNLGSTFAGLAYIAFDAGSDFLKFLVAEQLASLFTKQNLEVETGASADTFLKKFGVEEGFEGLDFSQSSVFRDSDFSMIDFVVEYDVNMSFAGLIMASPSIHIVQRVTIPAWLNGDEGEVSVGDDGTLAVTVPSFSK